MSLDHVVLRDSTCECLRCGATRHIDLPCSIDEFSRLISAFGREHKKCPPREGEP